MEKVVNSYETLFIVDVTNDETTKATVSKFTTLIANNAEIVEINEWGKRRLAYPINDKNDGYYVVVTFKAAPEFPQEMERLMNIDENLMRSLTLKLDFEAVPGAKKVPEEIAVNSDDDEAEEKPAEKAEEVAQPEAEEQAAPAESAE